MPVSRAAPHPGLRRSYDLRGTVGVDLTPADACAVGLAFAALARRRGLSRIAVSRDGRLSSPELEAALTDGLAAGGMLVFRLPMGPTPLLSYAVARLELDGGVMVTGSHNPPDQNGFKLLLGGEPLHGRALMDLWEVDARPAPGGGMEEKDVSDAYLSAIASELTDLPPCSVAWDCGNGATGEMVERLTARLPGRHVLLYTRVDGRFPNHHPDPSVPDNMTDLAAAVRENGCALGFAFDGDGDRIGAVDETGTILWPDQLLLLLAQDVLRDHPGSAVVADVKSSATLFDGLAAAGARAVMAPSGYVRIRERMLQEQAPLAGEMSGHIFFADRWHGSDDGLYVAARLLRALARSGRSLRAFRESLPAMVATPELRFPCPDAEKERVIAAVAAGLDGTLPVDRTDGLRVGNGEGWWLLRASGTEPKLTARCEAPDARRLSAVQAQLSAALREAGLSVPF